MKKLLLIFICLFCFANSVFAAQKFNFNNVLKDFDINVDSIQVRQNYMNVITFLKDYCVTEKKIYIIAVSYDKQTKKKCLFKEIDFTNVLNVNGLFFEYQEVLWVETNEICNSMDFMTRDNIDVFKKEFRQSAIDINFEKSHGSCIIV